MRQENVVTPDGAALHCEVYGQGPALLMVSGAGGDAGYYSAVAKMLSDTFTVITYDRRCNSRSTGNRNVKMSMQQQAEDAYQVIKKLAGGKAIVFGNSGGAIVSLALAKYHPEVVDGMIAHEPPIVKLLPESDPMRGYFDDLREFAIREGNIAGAQKFVAGVRGEGQYEWPADVFERVIGNFDHFFDNEFEAWGSFVPDFEALSNVKFPLIMAAGQEDRGLHYARPSQIIAEKLGLPWTEFTGYHLPFMERPVEFAATLRAIATQLATRLGEIPDEWKVSK